jgi:hypothetical protein
MTYKTLPRGTEKTLRSACSVHNWEYLGEKPRAVQQKPGRKRHQHALSPGKQWTFPAFAPLAVDNFVNKELETSAPSLASPPVPPAKQKDARKNTL